MKKHQAALFSYFAPKVREILDAFREKNARDKDGILRGYTALRSMGNEHDGRLYVRGAWLPDNSHFPCYRSPHVLVRPEFLVDSLWHRALGVHHWLDFVLLRSVAVFSMEVFHEGERCNLVRTTSFNSMIVK